MNAAYLLTPKSQLVIRHADCTLRQALEKRFGQPVVIEMKVDRSLLGGVRVRVGNTVLDGSVRGHLQAMRERMLSDLPQRPDEAAGASEKAEI